MRIRRNTHIVIPKQQLKFNRRRFLVMLTNDMLTYDLNPVQLSRCNILTHELIDEPVYSSLYIATIYSKDNVDLHVVDFPYKAMAPQ